MHYHSMGIIKIYFGKSQENLKNFSSRASKLQQEGLPPTDIFLRMALVSEKFLWLDTFSRGLIGANLIAYIVMWHPDFHCYFHQSCELK